MHAANMLHRILSARFPEIHAKRLTSLLAAVEAVVWCSRLTLSDLGRGLSGSVAVKHNIKRSVLLLVACLASFVLRLIGEVGKAKQLDFQFQSNTRRSRPCSL